MCSRFVNLPSLEKQQKDKKRMKQVGNVEIPRKTFLVVRQADDDDKW